MTNPASLIRRYLLRSRRGRLLAVASAVALLVAILLILVSLRPTSSRAVAELNVPSGGTAESPLGRPTEAIRLAIIYAELIPIDSAIDDQVTAVSEDVEVTAAVIPNTSLMTVRVSADDEDTANEAMAALLDAIASETPISGSIEPGTIEVANVDPAESLGANMLVTVFGALAVGLALGASAAIALDRADPLAEQLRDLRDLNIRASLLSSASTTGLRSLIHRWNDEVGDGSVAVLPGRNEPSDVAVSFVAAAEVATKDDLTLALVGSEGGVDSDRGVNAVLASDAPVLLYGKGASLRRIREDLEVLSQIGRPPLWVLLVDQGVPIDLERVALQPPSRIDSVRGREFETIEPDADGADASGKSSRWSRRQGSGREIAGGSA